MLRAVIVDDEPKAVELLNMRLAQHCPQIEVSALCTNSLSAVEAVKKYRPDILFLDIEMPQMNGFQVLESIGEINFALIFVTAYDRFALRAFKYSALDYLLKPIDAQELIAAVKKAELQFATQQQQINYLRQQLGNSHQPPPERIALPYQNGVAFIAVKDILYCESDDNYTRFYVMMGNATVQQHMALKPLREVQELLEGQDFLRVHRQYLVNLSRIRKFVKGEGNYLVMDDERSIPVARGQKDRLVERFGWL